MRTRVDSASKPIKGYILHSDFFRWPTKEGKHVVCVTGYRDHVSPTNAIRTSWVEKVFSTEIGRFIETRNSLYRVDMNDTEWKVLQDELKHEMLDVERMKS